MSDDLIERLQRGGKCEAGCHPTICVCDLCSEAAAELAHLRAEVQSKSEQIGNLYRVCNEKAVLQNAVERMRAAVQEACDLLAERKYGSTARSPSHNARLVMERALSFFPAAHTAPIGEDEIARAIRGALVENWCEDGWRKWDEDVLLTGCKKVGNGKGYQEPEKAAANLGRAAARAVLSLLRSAPAPQGGGWNEAIERAANTALTCDTVRFLNSWGLRDQIAAGIRALKRPSPPETGR